MLYFQFNCKSLSSNYKINQKKTTLLGKLLDKLYKKFIANPDFEDKIPSVTQWYLEYDEENDEPYREIGLDINQNVIVKMPDERNYGFWLDTNCTIADFKKDFGIEMIAKQDFYNLWNSVCYDRVNNVFIPLHS